MTIAGHGRTDLGLEPVLGGREETYKKKQENTCTDRSDLIYLCRLCLFIVGYFDLKCFVEKALLIPSQTQKSSVSLSGTHVIRDDTPVHFRCGTYDAMVV